MTLFETIRFLTVLAALSEGISGRSTFTATNITILDIMLAILVWPFYWFVWIVKTAWNWKMFETD